MITVVKIKNDMRGYHKIKKPHITVKPLEAGK